MTDVEALGSNSCTTVAAADDSVARLSVKGRRRLGVSEKLALRAKFGWS